MHKRRTKLELQIEALERELATRSLEPFSAKSVAGKHSAQLEYLLCKAQFAIALCSRRAGKTFANMVLLALTAMGHDGCASLYLGLTELAVKTDVISTIWNTMVKVFRLPFTPVNSEGITTCTATGSTVRFASIDDASHVEQFRGGNYANGCVIIDECQSVQTAVLKYLIEGILLPQLSSTTAEHPVPGLLRLSGTTPETPHGGFYHLYTEENDWSKFGWNRFCNPYLTNQVEQLEKKLSLLRITEDDPLIRRDDFGELVYDTNANAFRYAPNEFNTWEPKKLTNCEVGPFHCTFAESDGLDRFGCGIDPAQRRDRFAFVVFGWNSQRKDELRQLAECTTEPGGDPLESEWLEIAKGIKARYPTVRFLKDPGSSSSVQDLLYHSHGFVIEPAIKGPGSLKARVDRLADLLASGTAKIIRNGRLSVDLQASQWSSKAREAGKWELDKSNFSPDIADAATYAVPLFTRTGAQPPPAFLSNERAQWAADAEAEIKRIWQEAGKPEHRPRQRAADSLWRPPPF